MCGRLPKFYFAHFSLRLLLLTNAPLGPPFLQHGCHRNLTKQIRCLYLPVEHKYGRFLTFIFVAQFPPQILTSIDARYLSFREIPGYRAF